MTFTVLGASGFIGSHLVQRLRQLGLEYYAPDRGEELRGRDLGTLLYCAGVTADFRTRPFDAVAAHVTVLSDIVTSTTASSIVYLSSTRLYRRSPAREETTVSLSPLDPDHLYDISKLMGEAVTFASGLSARVLRLSNVYGTDLGSPTFLASIINDALVHGKIVFRTALASERDYVSVDDVVSMVLRVAMDGTQPMYNVASGINVTHLLLAERLAELTGCRFAVEECAPTLSPPPISIARVQEEFDFQPASVLADLPGLVESYRGVMGSSR